jgi:hypothetical protein
MRLNLLVGGQYAIINPTLTPVTKLNLVAAVCRRGHYGQRFEKCVACPAQSTQDGKPNGAECVGGTGPGTEPISAGGWFGTPLIKDDVTWAGNNTRSSFLVGTEIVNNKMTPITAVSVLARFEDDALTDFYATEEEKKDMVRVELSPNARRHLLDYSSFCNMTSTPNKTMCASYDEENCIPEVKYPPSAFWVGKDFKQCIHFYEPGHPKNRDPTKPMAELCEGKGADCCLSRWCAITNPKEPQKHGWSFVKKGKVGDRKYGEMPGAKVKAGAGTETAAPTEKDEKAEDEGCIIPIAYGDPRFYLDKENYHCRSTTHGWFVWQEDRVSSGRLPKRIKEQQLLDCNMSTWDQPPYRLATYQVNPLTKQSQMVRKVDEFLLRSKLPKGGIATEETYCLAAENLREADSSGDKSVANKARDKTEAAAENLGDRLRRFLTGEDADAAEETDSGSESGDADASSLSPSGAAGVTEGGAPPGAAGPDNRCHSDRWDRATCPYIVPCEPASACIGDNVCAMGYTGMKCAKCMDGYSRSDGVCVQCDSNPWIMIAFLLLGAVIAAVCYYIVVIMLKINVGVISIGIDYFQVIGLFSSQKIPWPMAMKSLFSYLSVFSFDMSTLGLECGGLLPHEMWFLTMLVPLGVVLALMAGIGLDIIRFMLMPKKNNGAVMPASGGKGSKAGAANAIITPMQIMESKIGMVITTFLTVFYLLYVQLTKKAMDIFNCAAADPPDDPNNPTTYMSIAPDQECWRPGTWETGMHVKLMPWAIVFIICYSLAFPMFMYFKFQKNKLKIFEDQLLAAQDRGENAMSNVNFSFRKRYSSMYKNYKPDKWYWPLVVLMKKLGICFTSLLFRRNPSFQLAVALMVLFTSFTMQVLHRPFMSMDERSDIVRLASKRDFERGHKMLRKMAAFGGGGDVERAKKRLAMEEQAQLTIARALTMSAKYFVNYNQVEAVFLGCAIYVCLAGVMFSSGYFVNEYYWAQRDGLGYLTLAIVLISTGYYFYVIGLEVTGVRKYRRHKNKAKWTAFKKKAHFHKDLFNLNNGNASTEEMNAACVIEACMKGRLARHILHERIMNGNNEEEKVTLARIEARVAETREQQRLKRQNKKAGSGTVALPMLKKKKKMKKKKTKKSSSSTKVVVAENKDPVAATKEKGAKLAGWGE